MNLYSIGFASRLDVGGSANLDVDAMQKAKALASRTIHHFEDDEDKGPADWISGIDISDPHNPVIFMSGGRKFVVRIIAAG